MRPAVLVTLAIAAVSLTACTNEAEQDAAVEVATAKIGDCLNIAGYDVRPERLKEDAGPGTSVKEVRVIFHSEQGADPINVLVTIDSQEVVGLDGGDVKRLQQAGCKP